MIKKQILCLGLTRVEIQTLYCRFPLTYRFCQVTAEDLRFYEAMQKAVSESLCLFINPKKLTAPQLEGLLRVHDEAKDLSHASILLFTDSFTREQRRYVDGLDDQHYVDLRARFSRTLRDVVEIIRNATFPCWSGLKQMEGNMFNDGWYLLDLTCTGLDPTDHHVIAIDIAFMANYNICSFQTIYIKPPQPLTADDEEITGITNEMLQDGITMEEAVAYINQLHYRAPFIVKNEKYDYAFLKAMYYFCGQKWDKPTVILDNLLAIPFGYMVRRSRRDLADALEYRRNPRTPVQDPGIALMYDLTLAAFENLQERYNVHAPGHFSKLYFSEFPEDM